MGKLWVSYNYLAMNTLLQDAHAKTFSILPVNICASFGGPQLQGKLVASRFHYATPQEYPTLILVRPKCEDKGWVGLGSGLELG